MSRDAAGVSEATQLTWHLLEPLKRYEEKGNKGYLDGYRGGEYTLQTKELPFLASSPFTAFLKKGSFLFQCVIQTS